MKNPAINYDNLLTLALWDASVDAMRITDHKGNVIKVNKSYCSLTGFTEEELIGKHFASVYKNSEKNDIIEFYNKFITGDEDSRISEKKVTFSNGNEHHLEVSYSRINLSGNNFILAVFRDITDFMKAVSEVKENKTKYENLYRMIRLMCDNSTDMIWAKDLNNKYLFANKAMCENLFNAKDTDEPVGKDDMFFAKRERNAHKDNPEWHTFGEICRDSDSIVLQNKKAEQFDEYGNVKGKFLFLDVHKAPIFDDNGNIIGVVGSGRDVTLVKKYEKDLLKSQTDLSKSEENYKNLVQSSHDVIIMIDAQGNFKFINDIAEKLTGFKISDWIGKSFVSLVHPEDLHIATNALFESLNGKQSSYVIRIFNSKGETLYVDISTVPVFDNGKVTDVVSICRDITKQKHAEKELKEIEKQQSLIFKSVPVAIYSAPVDPDIDAFWVSESIFGLTGYTSREFTSDPHFWSKRLHPEDAEKTTNYFRSISEVESLSIEYRWKIKSGEYRWFLDKSIVSSEEPQSEYFGIMMDITDTKMIEQALKESEEKYRILTEASPEMIFLVDKDLYVQYYNIHSANIINSDLNKAVGKHITEIFPSEDFKDRIENIKKVIESKQKMYFEFENALPEGQFWFETRLTPILNNNGEVTGVLGVSNDITQRKQMEKDLLDSEERFRAMVTNIDQIVMEFDENGMYINVWTEDNDLIAPNGMNWKGKNVSDVIGEELAADFTEKIRRVIKTGAPILYEYQLEVIGGLRWFAGRLNPVLTSGNKIKSVSFIARDITNRKLAEEEVILKNKELEIINSEKDKFFSVIAHDLKSPFNGFLGFTEMLKNDLYSLTIDELQDISSKLNMSANNLYNLLNNLLEWSMMQRGLTNFLPENYYLSSIVESSVNSEINLITQKELSYSTDIPKDITVFVDRKMMEFVFRNLIANSIKFTNRKGSISITASQEADNLIQVCVTDTGIGMNKGLVDELFKINGNVKRIGTEHEPSSGLGLILCKEFINKNGGTISVESKEGEGSTFCITLKSKPD